MVYGIDERDVVGVHVHVHVCSRGTMYMYMYIVHVYGSRRDGYNMVEMLYGYKADMLYRYMVKMWYSE